VKGGKVGDGGFLLIDRKSWRKVRGAVLAKKGAEDKSNPAGEMRRELKAERSYLLRRKGACRAK